MDHKTFDKIVSDRLREEQAQQTEKEHIQVVYTSANLVKAGQQIMRDRKKMQHVALSGG